MLKMMQITRATARNQSVSPKKARLVIDLVRGKNLEEAIDIAKFTNKKTASIVLHLLVSAADSANKKGFENSELIVSEAVCQEGRKLKRMFIRARGRSTRFLKRSCHIKIGLSKKESISKVEKQPKQEKAQGK
jgi:large subunit ribosomal protein L22